MKIEDLTDADLVEAACCNGVLRPRAVTRTGQALRAELLRRLAERVALRQSVQDIQALAECWPEERVVPLIHAETVRVLEGNGHA